MDFSYKEVGDMTPEKQPVISYDDFIARLKKETRWVYHPKYGKGWTDAKYRPSKDNGVLSTWFSDIQERHKINVSDITDIAIFKSIYWTWYKVDKRK